MKISRIFFLKITIIVLSIFASFHFASLPHDKTKDDIHFLWQEGMRITKGENPYSRILITSARDQDEGYAIYFPLFYIFAAFTQVIGLSSFNSWISFWQPVFLVANVGITFLLFNYFTDRKKTYLAVFAALFWLFNRYTLHGYQAAYMDFLPIFFLTFSLIVFPRNKWLSFYSFSLSLALKQLAIFILPVYLIKVWHQSKNQKMKNTLLAFGTIISLPLLASLPFLVNDFQGFSASILNSVYRGSYYFGTIALDGLLGLSGWLAKLPMLFLMFLVYLSAWKKKISLISSAFLIMFVFVDFNSVLFIQHLCWVIPPAILSLGWEKH